MSRVVRRPLIPEDWRLLRGLLATLGLGALVFGLFGLLQDPPWVAGPLWLMRTTYVGVPLVVAVAAGVIAWRRRRLRVVTTVVAVTAGLAFVANAVLVVWTDRLVDDLHEALGPSCRPPLSGCREVIDDAFAGRPRPLVPRVEVVAGHELRSVEAGPDRLAFFYGDELRPTLVYSVRLRRADGPAPPEDPALLRRSPGGRAYVELEARIASWDDTYQYVVGGWSDDPEARLALLDSAR